jgi:HD-like signal output (HDOD) protein
VANSAFFGAPTKVATVGQALVRMGLRNAQSVALGFTVVNQTEVRGAPSFDQKAFWRSSLVTAVAAKTIEERSRNQLAAEAFTAGLLQDIGILGLNNALKDEYEPVVKAWNAGAANICEMEQDLFGSDHCEIGAYLMGLWNVPETIVDPATAHHHPDRLESVNREYPRMARVLQTADAFMNLICKGGMRTHLGRCIELCKKNLSWPPNRLVPTVKEMRPNIIEIQRMLAVDVDADQVMGEARTVAATKA